MCFGLSFNVFQLISYVYLEHIVEYLVAILDLCRLNLFALL